MVMVRIITLREDFMRYLLVAIAIASLAGCGAETAGSAATAAAVKKQEIEQGKKTMEQVEAGAQAALEQGTKRLQQADENAGK